MYTPIKKTNKDNFLDSSEALQAKKDAEDGKVKTIGTLKDFDKWIDSIAN